MCNSLEVLILLKNKSNLVIYCHNIEYSEKGFTIQFLTYENNYDEMFLSKDDVLQLEVSRI